MRGTISTILRGICGFGIAQSCSCSTQKSPDASHLAYVLPCVSSQVSPQQMSYPDSPSFHPSTAFVRRVARLRRTSTADTRRRTSARRIGPWVPGPSGARRARSRAEPPAVRIEPGRKRRPCSFSMCIDEMTYSAAAAVLPGVHQHHQLQLELARKVHDTPETRRRMTRSKDR